jgi:hypothetical protein
MSYHRAQDTVLSTPQVLKSLNLLFENIKPRYPRRRCFCFPSTSPTYRCSQCESQTSGRTPSIDRNHETTLLFMRRWRTTNSNARDSSQRIVKLQDVSEHCGLSRQRKPSQRGPWSEATRGPVNHPIAPTESPKRSSTAQDSGAEALSQSVISIPQAEDTVH